MRVNVGRSAPKPWKRSSKLVTSRPMSSATSGSSTLRAFGPAIVSPASRCPKRSISSTQFGSTLVGATTREGLLSAPFRSRFGLLERLNPYPTDELVQILEATTGSKGERPRVRRMI